MVPILVLLMVIAFLTFDYVLQRRAALAGAGTGARDLQLAGLEHGARSVRDDRLPELPAGVFLAPGHTWLSIELDGVVKIGPGQLPLWLLGGGQIVSMLTPGTRVRPGDTLAVLREGERELRLRSAIEGTVLDVNDTVRREPTALRSAGFADTWLYRLAPRDLADALGSLRIGAEARSWLASELQRLRDTILALAQPAQAGPVLADGGLPQRGLAAQLDADVWRRLSEVLCDEPLRGPER